MKSIFIFVFEKLKQKFSNDMSYFIGLTFELGNVWYLAKRLEPQKPI